MIFVPIVADGNWIDVKDGNRYALSIYQRHYSCQNLNPKNGQFMPPGENLVLLTQRYDALFGWLHNTIERYDKQEGINCTVFRNEGKVLSSDLIREADKIALIRWPQVTRHFTYVDGSQEQSTNPGYCFIKAGWKKVGKSKGGLILFAIEFDVVIKK